MTEKNNISLIMNFDFSIRKLVNRLPTSTDELWKNRQVLQTKDEFQKVTRDLQIKREGLRTWIRTGS